MSHVLLFPWLPLVSGATLVMGATGVSVAALVLGAVGFSGPAFAMGAALLLVSRVQLVSLLPLLSWVLLSG